MSADNWRICPRCSAKDPFMDSTDCNNETLREDYEVRMSRDGVFRVDYTCRCTVCNFRFGYKQEIPALSIEQVNAFYASRKSLTATVIVDGKVAEHI